MCHPVQRILWVFADSAGLASCRLPNHKLWTRPDGQGREAGYEDQGCDPGDRSRSECIAVARPASAEAHPSGDTAAATADGQLALGFDARAYGPGEARFVPAIRSQSDLRLLSG